MSMHELQVYAGMWGQQALPNSTDEGLTNHLIKEAHELLAAVQNGDVANIGEECADIVLIAMHICFRNNIMLLRKCYEKMQINEAREFYEIAPGEYRHR